VDILCKQLICSEYFGDLDQLICVIVTMEESSGQLMAQVGEPSSLRFFTEDLLVSFDHSDDQG
jgi:hypothetical protein